MTDLSTDELEQSIAVATRAAETAIRITRESPLGEVKIKKNAADVVTAVDTAVERAVRDLIAAELPDHVVVGEEYGGTAGDGPTWYCDPVDGTTNLAAGIPWTSFSLSLAIGDQPLVAVVADPWRGEILSAAADRRTRINGEPVSSDPVSLDPGADTLTGGVIGTEWAGHQPWPGMNALLESLSQRLCTTRVMGSGTLTLAQPAAGRTLGAVIGEFHPEDHLAAALLCQQAGLAVLDQTGRPNPFPSSGGILVARPGVADELYALWTEALSIFLPSTNAST